MQIQPLNKHISNPEYSDFIALSRYARWLPDEMRRETWSETVQRYVKFWVDKGLIDSPTSERIYQAIYNKDVMPSMRALMTAGQALDDDNVAGFNCSYLAVDRIEAFDETMYILMCGTGVGFSCERQHINKLPPLPATLSEVDRTIVVEDTRIGWATGFRELMYSLYSGEIPKWDLSKIRPAGAKLKVFGGRASGAEPLAQVMKYTVELFISKYASTSSSLIGDTYHNPTTRAFSSLDVHGLMCMVAKIVVVGGVRRSALISLSNLSDDRMRHAKSGQWWNTNPEYALANNSVSYTEKPNAETFMREWLGLVESKSGERGIFNREAAIKQAAKNGRRDTEKEPGVNWDYGTNPCSRVFAA